MTWSTFVEYMLQNERHVSPKVWLDVRNVAKRRLQARMNSGRADSMLDFSDLVAQIESAMAPR